MQIKLLEPGIYIVAVSGGVDSMVLLELLNEQRQEVEEIDLIVAHLNHGIRNDSYLDEFLVKKRAKDLGLKFESAQASLGKNASEDRARQARYEFLNKVKEFNRAKALITAHHQDDVLETAIINMIRGTGRKGLSSLNSNEDVIRPLLNYQKKDIVEFAKANGIIWREDSTNNDPEYLRNYVRQKIVPRLNNKSRQELLDNIKDIRSINKELDTLLVKHLTNQGNNNQILRLWFNNLPHNVAKELMAAWLRQNGIKGFDKKMIERLVIAAKTLPAGKQFPLPKDRSMIISSTYLALGTSER